MALAYKFLHGLGEKHLNKNIVLEIEQNPIGTVTRPS
jgi:hypothetical protein